MESLTVDELKQNIAMDIQKLMSTGYSKSELSKFFNFILHRFSDTTDTVLPTTPVFDTIKVPESPPPAYDAKQSIDIIEGVIATSESGIHKTTTVQKIGKITISKTVEIVKRVDGRNLFKKSFKEHNDNDNDANQAWKDLTNDEQEIWKKKAKEINIRNGITKA